ncbi:AraC family transcriptional regulator [Chryseobacterium lactis]|uniref:AraC family transcriptional regulator n=1 Tax=Chryseobacterium lactis TaxID=1241981 RepID=A0A3G6RJE7_CHRLC|nr:AraC family transcriptional regulator [Chryseobacterium lactis]AZA83608.1 AraC family transcriptional regulator [Chryseobacterium lactis]AZB03993.1 AraC family transcriptional regulator [Chryseobacterium lactis]PNW13098.1 AraC family transcriptional regulator [Chryseobacterium lactis]
MENTTEIIFDKLVYSCAFESYKGHEEFIPDHFIGFQISGETHAFHEQGKTIIKENTVVLVRKNQLIRTIKYPSKNEKYQFLSIALDTETLRQYSAENEIVMDHPFPDHERLFFEPDDFFKSYFLSLLPYVHKTKEIPSRLAILKVKEAIELVLQSNPEIKNLLFDFSEPHKIDLKEFMNKNFMFNVSIEAFARLTGRSLSGFKRDFNKTFTMNPQQWLKERRLKEAYYLIKNKDKKPSDIYLDLGFENLSHFYFSFKKKFGVTTSEI